MLRTNQPFFAIHSSSFIYGHIVCLTKEKYILIYYINENITRKLGINPAQRRRRSLTILQGDTFIDLCGARAKAADGVRPFLNGCSFQIL